MEKKRRVKAPTKVKPVLRPVSYRIAPELDDALYALALARGLSVNTMVNQVLAVGVERLQEQEDAKNERN
jgi:predicted HicB family RNase H-like nuclease